MDVQGDPYRTLGVTPDASLNELRSAYRRLVKLYHPDAAGERALSRFLAIQAAYERLVDGEGRLRSAGGDPWRPGPAARRASRDAWRAQRSGARPGGTAAAGASRPAGGTRRTGRTGDAGEAGTAGTTGTAGTAGGAGTTGARPEGERTRRRASRKATPGSTSYDEAIGTPLDPEWDGGAWYGPSMGTYWTINPREYADPRKHGPEYLARARRRGAATPADGPAAPAAAASPTSTVDDADADAGTAGDAWAWSGRGQTTTAGDSADWAARAWTYDAGDAAWTPGHEGRHRPSAPPTVARPGDAPSLPDLETVLRMGSPTRLLGHARRDRVMRLIIALLGAWPIAYLVGTLASDATGCSSYSATCPDVVPLLPLGLLPALVLALYALPRAGAVAGFATLAMFAVAIPVGLVLSVGTGPRTEETRAFLLVAVSTTYVVAFAGAAWWLWKNRRTPEPGP